ncbi:hypothetical protein NP233_g2637 [Leucocoprinus birnbaumii]|uniref:Uncharacterized protein n=1 Tax=Leucocoprinus birnbaumii TaxID=56174 RepID=A0AAD5YTJ2_9AGAR|nr:hypothetical protein NP233_g2637 [Leucocoprinus birnbaumii]
MNRPSEPERACPFTVVRLHLTRSSLARSLSPAPLSPPSLSTTLSPSRGSSQPLEMPCKFSQENPDKLCLCSACHLSSELFPRRQDGKIILPGLPGSGGMLICANNNRPRLNVDLALTSVGIAIASLSPPDATCARSPAPTTFSGRADRGHRPRARSNARTLTPSSSSARLRSGTNNTAFPETPSASTSSGASLSTSNIRPRSRSQTFLTTTTAVANPYPIPVDNPYPKPSPENRSKPPTPESSSASTSAPTQSLPTPPLKFCPPFVASDRIAISPDSDAAKEGVTMIPWSVRRRKQKYRSGFDTGTGQGKGKTMFRYYGPDNDPPGSSAAKDTSKKQ